MNSPKGYKNETHLGYSSSTYAFAISKVASSGLRGVLRKKYIEIMMFINSGSNLQKIKHKN